MGKNEEVEITTAYAVVPTQEELEAADAVPLDNVELHQPAATTVSPAYQSIAEARSLTWRDDFFEDQDDVIAVFDFDYDGMESHYRTIGWGCFAGTIVCFPATIPWCFVGLVPCYLNKNVHWSVRARHLAVTEHGVLFVRDQRRSCWGDQCLLAKTSRVIPFEQIKDISVSEAGAANCMIGDSGLSKVILESPNRLMIDGLENPVAFQKLVLAMKRRQASSSGVTNAAPVNVAERIERGLASTAGNEEVASILREIRDELREHNEMLQSMKAAPLS